MAEKIKSAVDRTSKKRHQSKKKGSSEDQSWAWATPVDDVAEGSREQVEKSLEHQS